MSTVHKVPGLPVQAMLNRAFGALFQDVLADGDCLLHATEGLFQAEGLHFPGAQKLRYDLQNNPHVRGHGQGYLGAHVLPFTSLTWPVILVTNVVGAPELMCEVFNLRQTVESLDLRKCHLLYMDYGSPTSAHFNNMSLPENPGFHFAVKAVDGQALWTEELRCPVAQGVLQAGVMTAEHAYGSLPGESVAVPLYRCTQDSCGMDLSKCTCLSVACKT